MSEFEFKEGDRVTCAFYEDEVFTIQELGGSFKGYVSINFKGEIITFFKDGRPNNKAYQLPMLTLIERPLARPLPQLSGYMKVYHGLLYNTEAEAEASVVICSIGCIKVNGRD